MVQERPYKCCILSQVITGADQGVEGGVCPPLILKCAKALGLLENKISLTKAAQGRRRDAHNSGFSVPQNTHCTAHSFCNVSIKYGKSDARSRLRGVYLSLS